MAGLMYFVPVLIAEKIFLSGYIILLPASMRYVLGAIRPDARFFAYLVFPFIYNYLFHKGFYNFSYGLAMCFFVLGYWLKHQDRFAFCEAVTLSCLSLVLYFCHIVSLGMAYIAIALLGSWFTVFDLRRQLCESRWDYQALWKLFRTRMLVPFCALLPSLFLAAMFFLHSPSRGLDTAPFWDSLKQLLNMSSLVSLNPMTVWITRAFMCLFGLLGGVFFISKIVYRRLNRWDGLLLVAVVYTVLYFNTSEIFFMQSRLGLYPYLILIPWLAAQSYNIKINRIVHTTQGISVAIALVLLGVYSAKYAELNDYLHEYLSGMHLIESNTTLLPLSFSHHGQAPDGRSLSFKVGSFHFASGYIAAERHVVSLDNYEANTGFFPVSFRPELNAYHHIMDFMRPPLKWASRGGVDFLSYPQRTGGQVDYVLVWGLTEGQYGHGYTKSIFQQLEQGYELIYTSPQRGLMQLYQRKEGESQN